MKDDGRRSDNVHEALDGSENRYWSILNAAMDGFLVVDRDGRIIQANRSFCRMVGYSADELSEKYVRELDVREAPDEMEEHIRRIIDKGEDRFVTMYRRKDGSCFHAEVSVQYRPEGHENFVCFVRDVSKQVKAEQRLAQSEEEKRLILDSISDLVAFYDSPELRIAWSNLLSGHTVNAHSSALIGRKCHQIWAGSETPCSDCPVLETFRTGRKTHRVQTTADGRVWSIHAFPAFNEFGLLKGVVEVGSEITLARKNEASLRTALDRITFLVENSPLAVIEWEGGNRISAWSSRAEALFGWSAQEALGKDWRDLRMIPEEDLEDVEAQIGEMFVSDSSRNIVRNRNLTRNGRILDCVWYNSALKDDQGKVVTILSQVEDITAQRQTEREKELLEMEVRQAQKLESIGRLAGGVAHDLNNLLSPILGYAEIVLDDTAKHDPRYAAMEQIIGAGERARDLVHQLLAFSRKQALEFVPLNLNDLLERFLRLLKRTIRENILIELELCPHLPTIEGDMGHLEQVIMNLAVNAQDAMPAGGVLVLRTELKVYEDEGDARLFGLTPGIYVELEVRDTGEGMDRDLQDHIFEPFFTTRAKDKGTGLGLATVYGIVKQHGGHIRVESEPGQGTSFFIHFPVNEHGEKASAMKKTALAGSVSSSRDGKGTVLVAEDNEQVRDLAASVLMREGFEVLVAGDGEHGRELYQAHKGQVDLLLTDVIMPGMNGKELYEALTAIQPDLKAIFMSGYTDDVIGEHGVLEKGIRFLQKPFSILTLKKMVHEALNDEGCMDDTE